MSRPRFVFVCAFVFLSLLGSRPYATAQGYSRIFTLGDSLSDPGNLYRYDFGLYPPSPPYYQGRFSNGPVWVENIAPKLGLTFAAATDYAFGGAETNNKNSGGIGIGMQQELANLLKAYPTGDLAALYVVWGGANDYLAGATNTMTPVTNLINMVKSLAATGARNFLLLNLPDIGQTPGYRGTATGATLTQDSIAHNANLAAAVQTLRAQYPTSNILLFDTFTEFTQIIAHPTNYGFTNVTDQAKQAPAGTNVDGYLFWDDVHPTAPAHRLIASDVFAGLSVRVAGVVTLDSLAATAAPQTVTFQFRPSDGTANFTRTASVDATGGFTLTGIPAKHYSVWIKGAKWLAKVVPADATNGNVTGLTAFLPAGDANNDNSVDIADFGILISAYSGDITEPDGNYDARADFDGNGMVDVADFGVLVNNYSGQGDL